jgi:Holliday junction resolvasome RuvABC DNA-binding subunit
VRLPGIKRKRAEDIVQDITNSVPANSGEKLTQQEAIKDRSVGQAAIISTALVSYGSDSE